MVKDSQEMAEILKKASDLLRLLKVRSREWADFDKALKERLLCSSHDRMLEEIDWLFDQIMMLKTGLEAATHSPQGESTVAQDLLDRLNHNMARYASRFLEQRT